MAAGAMPALGLDDFSVSGWLFVLAVLVAAGIGAAFLLTTRRQGRAVEELQHSTAHVAAIVDSAMDAIVVMDQDGHVVQWNPTAERLFGWKAEEAEGRLVSEILVPERWRLDHEKGLSHVRRTGMGPVLGKVRELSALRKDGSELPVDVSVTLAVRDGDRATFVGYLRDVSARQRAERIQGVRFVVASVLSEARSLADATHGVAAAIGIRLRVPVVALWTPTLGGLGSDHQWAANRDTTDALLRLTATTTLSVGIGLPGRVWSQARALTSRDVPAGVEDVDRLRAAADAGLRHAGAVPVMAGDKVLAVIELFCEQPDALDDETLRTLTDIGGQLGQFLARRRAEAMQESPERLHALLEHAADAVVTVGDDGGVLGLNERARALFGVTTLEVLGDDVRTLVADDDRTRFTDHVADRLAGGAGRRWVDVSVRRGDGTTTEAAVRVTPLTVARRQVFLCIVTDSPDAAELRVIHPKDARRDRFA
jgi:PAS domain S-box-containing protein